MEGKVGTLLPDIISIISIIAISKFDFIHSVLVNVFINVAVCVRMFVGKK